MDQHKYYPINNICDIIDNYLLPSSQEIKTKGKLVLRNSIDEIKNKILKQFTNHVDDYFRRVNIIMILAKYIKKDKPLSIIDDYY